MKSAAENLDVGFEGIDYLKSVINMLRYALESSAREYVHNFMEQRRQTHRKVLCRAQATIQFNIKYGDRNSISFKKKL